jgi:hypothetical protein
MRHQPTVSFFAISAISSGANPGANSSGTLD